MASDQDSEIKQGSIADFMRKRTQLVGFDFGLSKHTQYAVEFVDNALDAIEIYQWRELKKTHDQNPAPYALKDDAILENFDYLKGITEEDIAKIEKEIAERKASQLVDDEGYQLQEDGTLSEIIAVEEALEDKEKVEENPEEIKVPEVQAAVPEEEDEEAKKLRQLQKKAQELEKEVQKIVDDMQKFVKPILPLIEREPFVIVRLIEQEAPAIYKDITKDSKDVFQYTLEVFDNGPGMPPDDLEKFGKYLASSKSQRLKQTRGSQGFGASRAFSDAQNTTGRPITVISKHNSMDHGIATQFYTTSKNNKEYVVPPKAIECPFSHGTYIKLTYLNVKYKQGYVDSYIELNSLTNPHITFVYIDPKGNQDIYPRRVNRFPAEPKYAMPHPTSVNIGDFQDLLRSSSNNTVSAFLANSFVRMSTGLAKTIVDEAEEDLQDKLNLLILNDKTYISRNQGTTEPIYLMRIEQRIYGKSKKPRDILVFYLIEDEGEKNAYYEIITRYNHTNKDIHTKINKIAQIDKEINKSEDKKQIKELNKEIIGLDKEIAALQKELKEVRKSIAETCKAFSILKEIQEDNALTDKLEEQCKEVQISRSAPQTLTQNQTEALFRAFKNQKYMSPPTDTAIPIGASILETTLIKEFKLALSHRVDLFLKFSSEINPLNQNEKDLLLDRILTKFKDPAIQSPELNYKAVKDLPPEVNMTSYEDFLNVLDASFSTDEDFVAGYTRQPTSGKGLAYVVEAAIAISPKIAITKTAQQSVMRYVNRTPKLRDSSDCAIWKAVQLVNWKNYKVDSFDNGIPRGELRILVNVSGPFVHLMFKSQSKNALAEDEVLMKEIKFCLETIGRKIRNFLNRKIRRETTAKRSKTIEKYIPLFLTSLMNVTKSIPDLKNVNRKDLESRIMEALNGKIEDPYKKKKSSEEEESESASDEEEDAGEDEEGHPKRKPKKAAKSEIEGETEEETEEESEEEDEDEEHPNARPGIEAKEVEELEEVEEKIEEKTEIKPKPIDSLPKIEPKETAAETPKKTETKTIEALVKRSQKREKSTSSKSSTGKVSETPRKSKKETVSKAQESKASPPKQKVLEIASDATPKPKPELKLESKPEVPLAPNEPKPVRSMDDILKKAKASTPAAPKPTEPVKGEESTHPVKQTRAKKSTKRSNEPPAKSDEKSPRKGSKAKKSSTAAETGQKAAKPSPQEKPLEKPPAPERLEKPKTSVETIRSESILGKINPGEEILISDIIQRLGIGDDKLQWRYLQIQLKTLQSQKKLQVIVKGGKTYYKLP